MFLARRLTRSFTDCMHIASISSVFGRIVPMQSTRDVNAYIQRLQTMAKLGENLFEIKVQEGHLDLQRQSYENEARELMQQHGRDEHLQVYFQRVREVRMQIKALQQSARTISATINSIESQGNIEKIKRVLHYTVETHKMAQENSLVDTTSDHLLEGFEQISNTIEQEKTILDTLDTQINDLRQERPMDLIQVHDSEFDEWKAVLRAGVAVADTAPAPAAKVARVVDVVPVQAVSQMC